MKNVSKKLYYLFLAIIFQTFSITAMRLYLNLFKDHKSHPYIITGVYFMSYLFFIIIFYLSLPKKKKNDLSDSDNIFRKRANSIKLYKRNSIITIEEVKKNKKRNSIIRNDKSDLCNQFSDVYCIKNEVIYPSIFLSIGQGINIYTLGKINVALFLMINGNILISLFRIMKSRTVSKIKPNKVVSGVFITFSILAFIAYHLFVSVYKINHLFFILFTFLASILVCISKYYNFSTIHRYNIDFISSNIKVSEKTESKEEILIDNEDEIYENNKNNHIINSINYIDEESNIQKEEDNISTGSSSNNSDNNEENKKNTKNKINQYFSYEKIIFYEGALCFCFWVIIIFILSFIKCPENNYSFFKIFICNNCTTMSGYETFFNSKELIIFNNVQYKNELIKYIYEYPLCSIIFIIIIIITQFFHHFSFEKIFQGKYKTKLVLLLYPIVSSIILGLEVVLKKYAEEDSFLEQILTNNIYPSEIILCIALFIGSILSYIRIFEIKCKK